MTPILFFTLLAVPQTRVSTSEELRQAVQSAKPGAIILLEPGQYRGGVHLQNLHGAPGKPIVIRAANPENPPQFRGGGSAIQLSEVTYVTLENIHVEDANDNGLNVDDGGTIETPSHHITLRNIRVANLPKGNHDGIKLSGIEDFRVENCTIERWGGSAIDMVGCHRGVITEGTFSEGGDSGVQCKGGTSQIKITNSRFENPGERAINIGGSTGVPFFRPPLQKMPAAAKYEAKDILVEGNTFTGATSPFAFVGVDGARVRYNTVYHPQKWVVRILQETTLPGFVPCRNGVFEKNLIVFQSQNWSAGGFNIGPNTNPQSFRFSQNLWYCEDHPERSQPTPPTEEQKPLIGLDPKLRDPKNGDFTVLPNSPAKDCGAHALKPELAH